MCLNNYTNNHPLYIKKDNITGRYIYLNYCLNYILWRLECSSNVNFQLEKEEINFVNPTAPAAMFVVL